MAVVAILTAPMAADAADAADARARLESELLLCWLAQAVAQVAERAAEVRRVEAVTFATVGPIETSDESLRAAQTLAKLVDAFVANRSISGHERDSSAQIRVQYLDVPYVDSLAHHVLGRTSMKTILTVIGSSGSDPHRSHSDIPSLAAAGYELLLWVTRSDVSIAEAPAWPWTCSLVDLARDQDDQGSLSFLQYPLDQLSTQCGWRIALEVLSWVDPAPQSDYTRELTPLFTTTSQLPFQLLLLLLRWSFFHPSVVRLLGKKLARQLQLTPVSRIRCDVSNAQQFGRQLWRHLYTAEPVEETLPTKSALRSASSFLGATLAPLEDHGAVVLRPPPNWTRLSKCLLWDVQKQFYIDRGIKAWSSGVVPFGVSSSSFIAAAYARVAVDFLLSQEAAPVGGNANHAPNCFVWEAASGSCKFLHHFLLHFYAYVEHNAAVFRRRRLVPLVVASDLSDQVLESRMLMPCFQPYLDQGKLEFAKFDTAGFVSGPDAGLLQLRRSGRAWRPGRDGPLFLMGNYFFDSLRTDVFGLTTSASVSDDLRPEFSGGSNDPVRAVDKRCFIHEVAVDPSTWSIAEMELAIRQPIEVTSSKAVSFLDNEFADSILHRIINEFRTANCDDKNRSRSALILFPTEAIAFLSVLIGSRSSDELATCSNHAIALIAGDAGFSFRDAIPSAFLTGTSSRSTENSTFGSFNLELPQLSPHPDCFCLPVDFEIFRFVMEALGTSCQMTAAAQKVSALASDTFDVFFSTLVPTPTATALLSGQPPITSRSHSSFCHEFASFTPGDCDLLWGMMSIDDGARRFSTASQLALMEQTAWDFDLFAAVQWPLAHRWRAERRPRVAEAMRLQLIAAGVQSWRSYYRLEELGDDGGEFRKHDAWLTVQVARWFYVLQAYDVAVDILKRWNVDGRSGEKSIPVLYLLGLAYARLNDHWKALAIFRTCARLAPTHLKFQTRVAATLLELQRLRQGSKE